MNKRKNKLKKIKKNSKKVLTKIDKGVIIKKYHAGGHKKLP